MDGNKDPKAALLAAGTLHVVHTREDKVQALMEKHRESAMRAQNIRLPDQHVAVSWICLTAPGYTVKGRLMWLRAADV